MEEKKSKQIIKYIFIVLLVSVFAYLIVGECMLPADDLGENGSVEKYSGTWERVLPNERRISQKIPGHCDAKKMKPLLLRRNFR